MVALRKALTPSMVNISKRRYEVGLMMHILQMIKLGLRELK